MGVIQIEHLTKDFGYGRGIFDVSLEVEKGEVYGFLGPNGAGKSTTIRHIMGFTKADTGTIFVNGKNAWHNSYDIQKMVGYLPGEFAFPENLTGTQFIDMMAELRNISDLNYTNELIKKFKLDSSISLKRMSLGMKRKLAIVVAFMHDPEILILDEPTSGLDPIMQQVFIDFIKEEKERGKTILLSSHIFSEINATCDKISMIKDGKIISNFLADDLRHNEEKTFKIEFIDNYNYNSCKAAIPDSIKLIEDIQESKQLILSYNDSNTDSFISFISTYEVKFCSEVKFTLEDYFMSFYKEGEK